MKHREILDWLRETDPDRLTALWMQADAMRRRQVTDAVYLRGLIEVSNCCVRSCQYCGLRAPNRQVERYRLTTEQVMGCVRQAVLLGLGTVVLQAGEDYALTTEWVGDLIVNIKAETDLAVTLSLGERGLDELTHWRSCGADRYLLRFETSNRALYEWIHPDVAARRSDRVKILRQLAELGYEVGSGVMIGIPGQSWDDLANDLELFARLGLDMIGVGPFIPHGDTPMGTGEGPPRLADDRQVPNDELTTYKVMALARMLCPTANIPSTTALDSLNRTQGHELALSRGANVIMPNLTPEQQRRRYCIYPQKVCFEQALPVDWCAVLGDRIADLGRTVGLGRGDSPHWLGRRATALQSSQGV